MNAMKRLATFLVTAVLLMNLFTVTFSVSAEETENAVTSVTLSKDLTELEIAVSLSRETADEHRGEKLYLFELPAWDTIALAGYEPIAVLDAAERIRISIPFSNDEGDRRFSYFTLAEKIGEVYRPLTRGRYLTDPTPLASNNEPYPVTGTIKGLLIDDFTEAQRLGARHTVIDLPINEYILGEDGKDAISVTDGGETYYWNQKKITELDRLIYYYSDAGIQVYLNLILTAPPEEPNPVIASFYYDGISEQASLYAFQASNATAMRNLQAFLNYIAERYTRSDHAYGFAANLIVGFQANEMTTWNDIGHFSEDRYADEYARLVRAAYTAMVSHYTNGRVYLSLGNRFHTEQPSEKDGDLFLKKFAEAVRDGGDFPWGVAVNPYASDLARTDFWNDPKATEEPTTGIISAGNLIVLTAYLHRDAFLYQGKPRSVIVSEFGLPSRSGDAKSEDLQAAAMALAYYTSAEAGVDAFIWGRQTDSADAEGGMGLSVLRDGKSEPKKSGEVFALLDSEGGDKQLSFIKETAGTEIYKKLLGSSFRVSRYTTRKVITAEYEGSVDLENMPKDKILFDWSQGDLCNFLPSDIGSGESMESKQHDDRQTSLWLSLKSFSDSPKGIGRTFTEEEKLSGIDTLCARVMPVAPSGVTDIKLTLWIRKNATATSPEVFYESTSALKANEWNDICFDIRDFVSQTDGAVDQMKILFSADDNGKSGERGVWLDSITIVSQPEGSVIGTILLVLLILVLTVAAGYGILFARAKIIRYRRKNK